MGRNKKPSGGKPPKLNSVGYEAAAKVFGKLGFVRDRQMGDHIILVKPGHPYTISLPAHRPVAVGTLKQCIRAAGITPEEFNALL